MSAQEFQVNVDAVVKSFLEKVQRLCLAYCFALAIILS